MKSYEEFARDTLQKNPFSVHLMDVTYAEKDRLIVKMDVCPECKNIYGYVHGGAICTLAETAAGLVAHNDGRNYVSQGANLIFISNQNSGTIFAEAVIRHRGKSTVIASVNVSGQAERLIATGEFTLFVTAK